MPFTMDKPQQVDSSFESVVFPPNEALEFSLERVEAGMYEAYKQDGTREAPYPHFRFVYKDAEGDLYQTQPMRFPKGFAYNEKAGLWKHVGALFGRDLTEEDTGAVEIDLGPGFDTWEDCLDLTKMPKLFAKKDEVRPLIVKSIKVHGKELVTSESRVRLIFSTEKSKTKRDEAGNPLEYSKLKGVLPYAEASGKKKKNLPVE